MQPVHGQKNNTEKWQIKKFKKKTKTKERERRMNVTEEK